MIVKQISVFLENKSGALSECINALGEKKIDLLAMSIAEATDYGVLRIIVDQPELAEKTLREQSWICTTTDILAVTVPDEPGSLIRIVSVLADNHISLAYSYAFFSRKQGRACIVLRVDDNAVAAELLKKAGIDFE